MAEISPLRRRMIEDMTVRNLSPATQQSYLNAVSKFSRYFGRSPDRLGLEDVHAFQVHLVATGISWPALNQIVCALRVPNAAAPCTGSQPCRAAPTLNHSAVTRHDRPAGANQRERPQCCWRCCPQQRHASHDVDRCCCAGVPPVSGS